MATPNGRRRWRRRLTVLTSPHPHASWPRRSLSPASSDPAPALCTEQAPRCQYFPHREAQDCQYHRVNTLYTDKHKTSNTTVWILFTQTSIRLSVSQSKYSLHETAGTTAWTQTNARLPISQCQYSLHRQAQDSGTTLHKTSTRLPVSLYTNTRLSV